MMAALAALTVSEDIALFVLFFEVVSALGTVGLSLGATAELSAFGKWLVIFLMMAGRVGVLAFGMALASEGDTEERLDDAGKVED